MTDTRVQHRTVDYDVHGLAGVRLVDASPRDAAAVRRQLGPLQGPFERTPDIIVRFVDRLDPQPPVRLIGKDEAGYTDDAFLVLRGKHKARTRVLLPLDRIGNGCEIVCERGIPAVPYLIPILNLTILLRGALPLHASAFSVADRGVVTTGWSKGGKTEALLVFMKHGAHYVADEWAYVTADGRRVYGLPEPIRVWGWHLDELPTYRARIGLGARARLRCLSAGVGVTELVGFPAAGRTERTLQRGRRLLEGQQHVDVEPEALFRQEPGPLEASFDQLFLMTSWERPSIVVRPIDPMEVGARMSASLAHERHELAACIRRFDYAFPDRSTARLLERAEECERALLRQVLSGRTAYAVDHPSPMSLEGLYDAMIPYCS